MEVGFGLGSNGACRGVTVDEVVDDSGLWGRSSWLPSLDPDPDPYRCSDAGPPPPPRRLLVNPGLWPWPRTRPVPDPAPREDRNGCVDRKERDDWYWSSW